MQMQRFDFSKLQDFRMPLKPTEEFVEIELIEKQEPAAPPPAPTFSEAELEAAKKAAREEGRKAGVDEGIAQAQAETTRRDQSIEQSVHQLVRQAVDITVRHQGLMRAQCAELLPLVMMITRKVAGDAITAMPEASIETLIQNCLNVLVHQPRITLLVHPSLVDEMTRRVNETIQKLRAECTLTVLADDQLAAGEAKLEWKDGRAERKLDTIWQQIETMLQSVDFTAIAALETTEPVTEMVAPSTTESTPLESTPPQETIEQHHNEGEQP